MFTHDELVDIGYQWVVKRSGFAFKELSTANETGEIPDVLGFNSNGTFLLEAKVSRSDFLSDKKKIFRVHPEQGMGDWRFFIVPKGLVSVGELPENWWLIEVNEKGKARIKHNPFGKGNIYSSWSKCPKKMKSEWQMMYSALRRLHLRNRLQEIYQSPFK